MRCTVEGCGNKSHAGKECSKHLRLRLYGTCKNGCTTPANAKHGLCSRCVQRGGPPTYRPVGRWINNDVDRYCWSCKETKSVSDFPRNAANSTGLGNMCKNCMIVRNKGYDRDAILKEYEVDGKVACHKCGEYDRLEIDHIIPRSLGGSDYKSNLQILCRTCNAAKKNREAIDYRKENVNGYVSF